MIKRTFILLVFCMSIGLLFAQTLSSPDGKFAASFSIDDAGTPIYTLDYKGSSIIKPSKLGLELMSNNQEEFNTEIKKEKNHETSLYDGFHVVDIKNTVFDETWQPVWGETATIRNHYNEMAVALN